MSASRSPSLLTRSLEPLVASLWFLFVVFTGLVLAVWTIGWGEADLARISNRGLRGALSFFLGSLDAAWFTLAAANSYLGLCETEGLTKARRWTVALFAGVVTISVLTLWTGWPLGAIHYTSRLGTKILGIPFGLFPLTFVILMGARSAALWIHKKATPLQLASVAGTICGSVQPAA